MKKIIKLLTPILCLAATYPVAIAHNYVSDEESSISNWIIFDYKPMRESWNMAFMAWHVIIPILWLMFVVTFVKNIEDWAGKKIPKIYKIELRIAKWFIFLNSISYFLIFMNGPKWWWIFWIISIVAIVSWYLKSDEDKLSSNE